MVTYNCPFGASVIRAESQAQLEAKIWNHNIYAHGAAPIIVCSASPLNRTGNSATAPCRHSSERRPFALSRRGL